MDVGIEIILAQLPGYVYWKNDKLEYMWCNNNVATILGFQTSAQIKGKTDHDLVWGDAFADNLFKQDKRVLKEHIKLTIEEDLPIKRADGHYFHFRTEKIPLYDDKHNCIGILGISVDITDQNLAEQETHLENTLIEDILYNLPGMIYWKNKKSQYMGFNKNVIDLIGMTKDELRGKSDHEIGLFYELAEQYIAEDQAILETGDSIKLEQNLAFEGENKRALVVQTEKSRLHDRQGNIAGILGVTIDITEQKLLQESLKKLLDEKNKTEKISQAKTDFIRNIEHDIRTPFGGIFSIAKILEDKEEDQEKRYLLNAIGRCAKELLDYCNGLLDFSIAESGGLPLSCKEFDLKKMMESVIAMETPVAVSKQLTLDLSYPADMPAIFSGDEYRIQRILINLVNNAIKFTEKGFVKLALQIIEQEKAEQGILIQFIVEDSGIGIPKDKQEVIFEHFKRLASSSERKYTGSGLGLSVVKQLVSELSGEISLESKRDKGSIFKCNLLLQLSNK